MPKGPKGRGNRGTLAKEGPGGMRSPGHPPTKRGKEQGQRGPWATWGPRAPNKEERGQGGRKEGKDRGKGVRRERERERGPPKPHLSKRLDGG